MRRSALAASLRTAPLTLRTFRFENPFKAGETQLLRPEDSMRIQHSIGADIMMQLDDVVSSLTEPVRMKEASERSVRWLDRCIAAHSASGKDKTQNLFAIVQGGLDKDLRDECKGSPGPCPALAVLPHKG